MHGNLFFFLETDNGKIFCCQLVAWDGVEKVAVEIKSCSTQNLQIIKEKLFFVEIGHDRNKFVSFAAIGKTLQIESIRKGKC